ncbi:MAG: ABC transporter ATP-binding protein/permease [Acidobacteria bacterium]|nr:ABC transporter ATP-binding protein/permease [Acidobacteriota bacterium]
MSSAPVAASSWIRRALKQLPFVPRAFGLVRESAGGWMWGSLGLLLLMGLLPVVPVLLVKRLVDALVGGGDLGSVLFLVGLLGLALLLVQALEGLARWARTLQSERIQDHVLGLVHAQAQRLDLGLLETPEYYDQLHRAKVDAVTRPLLLLENLGALLQNGLTLAVMAVLLLRFAPWLPLLLAGSMLPALAVVARNALRQHAWRRRRTPDLRRANYFDWLLTERDAAMELRLFRLGAPYQEAFQDLRRLLRGEQSALAGTELRGSLAAGLVAVAGAVAGLAWMVARTQGGQAGLGDLALFAQVFFQGQRLLHTLLGQAGEIFRNMLFLENLFEFLDLRPALLDPPPPPRRVPAGAPGLAFEAVRFRYPGSEAWALDNFELRVPPGSVAAIVGENGAGKSTLVKLLCRFHDPEGGRVLFAGEDLRTLPQEDLRRRITVLFQNPVHYHATVSENIAQSDLRALEDPARIRAAAREAGAEEPVGRLPRGYDTVLGHWFGGAELSAGEWQRLALARAFLSPAPLLILDEPTSAMDSWSEADWLDRFRRLAAGRTVLLITHRFTTAMQADRIHVMARGRIVEEGSHAELLSQGGAYAQSWQRQVAQGR